MGSGFEFFLEEKGSALSVKNCGGFGAQFWFLKALLYFCTQILPCPDTRVYYFRKGYRLQRNVQNFLPHLREIISLNRVKLYSLVRYFLLLNISGLFVSFFFSF